VTKFSCRFFAEVPRGYTDPTMTSQVCIPLFPVAGSWIQVSVNVVLNSHWLTKAQAANGRFLVTLWSPCLFRSGKGFQLCGGLRVEFNIARRSGQNFTLQPTDYMIGPASGNPNMCLTWPRANQPTPDGIDWQLGALGIANDQNARLFFIPRFCIPPFGIHYLQASVPPVLESYII